MKERMILGKNAIFEKIDSRNNNIIVIGGTGSGKTVSIVEPELLETLRNKEINRVVICTKRLTIEKYILAFKKIGYKVYDMNLSNPIKSEYMYDPLSYINEDTLDEDIMYISRSIIMSNPKKENSRVDPYWDISAISLLSSLIWLTLKGLNILNDRNEKKDFSDVLELVLLAGSKKDKVNSMFEDILQQTNKDKNLNNKVQYYYQNWLVYYNNSNGTASCIYSTMNSTLSEIPSAIRDVMKDKPAINFNKFAHEKSIIFITTNPMNKGIHSFANIFVDQMIKDLFEIAEQNINNIFPTHISFDDFATGAKIADFNEKISIVRQYKISFTILLQSKEQLERMYGNSASTEIIDNFDQYVYMGSNNMNTAKDIAIKLNVPITDVLEMPIGKIAIFIRGKKPIITDRYCTKEDNIYKQINSEYESKLELEKNY